MSRPQPLNFAAIQARCDAATPGPWYADGPEIYAGDPDMHTLHAPWVGETCNVDLPDHGEGNAIFVAAARTDVEQLLDRVRELETALAGMADLRDRAIAQQDKLRDQLAAAEAVALSNQRAARMLAEDVQRLNAEVERLSADRAEVRSAIALDLMELHDDPATANRYRAGLRAAARRIPVAQDGGY